MRTQPAADLLDGLCPATLDESSAVQRLLATVHGVASGSFLRWAAAQYEPAEVELTGKEVTLYWRL